MPDENHANGTKKPTEWSNVNWRKINQQVRNLRQRIFRATQTGNFNKVRSLQKLMLRSHANTLLSVRKVTQVNAGRNTAGIDKLVIKTPAARGQLVDYLSTSQPWKVKPARRVYIPKASGKLRPGRGCHDAIGKIFNLATPNKRRKWVVDADIKGCFDNIDHQFLLDTIGPVPGRELIKQWLKAGYVDKEVFYDAEAGTPQGGVISPLLANIALHGMEKALGVKFRPDNGVIIGGRAVVRYADDFVVFCESKSDAEQAEIILKEWLGKRGLYLSKEKTQIVHLTQGFDFLGFNIRQYKDQTRKTGYKLLIKPSKKSVLTIRKKLQTEWTQAIGSNVSGVIKRLNPIIRGWANYFRIGVAKEIFHKLDHWMLYKEQRYSSRTHPKKAWGWKYKQYWGRMNLARKDNWVFGDKHTGISLLKFTWFDIRRHALVPSTSSPDDPSLKKYWQERIKTHVKNLASSDQRIAKNQKYACEVCKESLFNGEELQTHHVKPRSEGGKDTYHNLRLVHLYCHQQIHSK